MLKIKNKARDLVLKVKTSVKKYQKSIIHIQNKHKMYIAQKIFYRGTQLLLLMNMILFPILNKK